MKRCKRCILPQNFPGIHFDRNGVCNYCLDYRPIKYLGMNKLEKKIKRLLSSKRKYDCLVPLSGGRDSTYVLYLATKRLNLNVLAVHYDNGFKEAQAYRNMKTACKTLGAHFVNASPSYDINKKIVRAHAKNSLCSEPLGTNFCSACKYGYRAVTYRMAEKYNIPLILWGQAQIENIGKMLPQIDSVTLPRKVFRRVGWQGMKVSILELMQRIELPVKKNILNNLFLQNPVLKQKNTEEIRLFDYIPWNRMEIKDKIVNRAGWRQPLSSVSTWRTDCRLEILRNHISYTFFGCTAKGLGYCNMINEGQMTRSEALSQEKAEIESIQRNLKNVLKEFGISDELIKNIKSFEGCK